MGRDFKTACASLSLTRRKSSIPCYCSRTRLLTNSSRCRCLLHPLTTAPCLAEWAHWGISCTRLGYLGNTLASASLFKKNRYNMRNQGKRGTYSRQSTNNWPHSETLDPAATPGTHSYPSLQESMSLFWASSAGYTCPRARSLGCHTAYWQYSCLRTGCLRCRAGIGWPPAIGAA